LQLVKSQEMSLVLSDSEALIHPVKEIQRAGRAQGPHAVNRVGVGVMLGEWEVGRREARASCFISV
jgi:hypothetical protein